MKFELSVTPPVGLKETWPGQFEIGRWLDNMIPFPMQMFIITTRKPNGLYNAQLNAWGMTAGPGSSPLFLFQDSDNTDTHSLIKETGEFVINLCSRRIKEQALKTTEHYGEDIDEVIASGLTPIDGLKTHVCRIAECVAHYECTLEWMKELGKGQVLTCGQIVSASVDEELLTGDMNEKLKQADIMFYMKTSIDPNQGWEVSEKSLYGSMSPVVFE